MATQQQLADHLDLSSRRVRDLVRDGVLPSSKGPGGYDLDACRLAYIRYLRGVGSGQVRQVQEDGDKQPTELGDGQRDYSAELEKEKWREKKRANDLAEGVIAPVAMLTDALQKVGTQIVTLLEALPLEMKRMNPRLTGHDIQTVKKSIAKCCNAIAETEIESDGE